MSRKRANTPDPHDTPDSSITTFAPDRTHLLAAAIMVGILLLVIGADPLKLFWLLIIPILFIVWVLRSRTTVDEHGITATYAFARPRTVKWEECQGVGFAGSKAVAHTLSGETFSLPGVSFNSLPQLEEASKGRIPDALTQARTAADDKVVIVHKDGRQVLMNKEDYEAQNKDEK
ncbi:PH domain-containing protein [Corynebacterium felinum]|uniref:Low molecular weight protein antigen 6 PH domain-containing protein n=1 Tax=Corynebacterium felinum TaxID=131318 RepID=A0ABU2BAK1_9CORY|nr:PH domain-containing protein [Corynebacterium felinum]MDF5821805.1 PH domain-containing protein [Corynebacterium felinum]MDR7355386.1 hypothetical protein [Corynebacterium felinum]WJY94738.1 Low molecular weight protein antigen 6 [Corynebacterium felinum]